MGTPEVTGRVSALVGDAEPLEADITVESPVSCARCREGRGCGAGLLGAGGGERVIRVRVPAGMRLSAGDHVRLNMSGQSLLNAAQIAYGLPLAGLLAGALCGQWLTSGDAAAVLTALAGLTAGVWTARHRAARFCWQNEASGLLRLEANSRR